MFKQINSTVGIISGMITIFVFLTGISSLTLILNENEEFITQILPSGLSFSLLLLLTMLIFSIFYIVQVKISKSLCDNNMLTYLGDFDEMHDYFFVFFFAAFGLAIISLFIEAFWGLDWLLWKTNDKIFISIYLMITLPISVLMPWSAKTQGSQ